MPRHLSGSTRSRGLQVPASARRSATPLTSVNDYDVKVVKIQGEFVWHTHPDTDELFMVVHGELTIQLRDRDVVLRPNDVFVVPKGVEHCPKSEGEVHAILFERQGTANTGDAGGDRTAQLCELGH